MWAYLLTKHSVTLHTSVATYEQRTYERRNIRATQHKADVYSQVLSRNVGASADVDNVFQLVTWITPLNKLCATTVHQTKFDNSSNAIVYQEMNTRQRTTQAVYSWIYDETRRRGLHRWLRNTRPPGSTQKKRNQATQSSTKRWTPGNERCNCPAIKQRNRLPSEERQAMNDAIVQQSLWKSRLMNSCLIG